MIEKKRKILFLSLALTLVAVGLHFYLTQKFFALRFGAISSPSACNINSFLNCDAVSASRFASFFGRPLALWGLVTNILFALVMLLEIWNLWGESRRGKIFTWFFCFFIASISVVMAVISLMWLNQICLFCFAAYIISWTTFFLLTWAFKPGREEVSDFLLSLFSSFKAPWAFVVAVPILTWILNNAFLDQTTGIKSSEIERLAQERVQAWSTSPVIDFDQKLGLVLGSANNPRMTITEFADFRCIHCKMAYPTLHAFAAAHADVKLIYKTYPLDGTCNPDPAFEGRGDGVSCRLALGALCAEKVHKKGWDLHHYIFDNQEDFKSINQIEKIDEKLCSSLQGFNCEQMKACMNDSATVTEIKLMSQEAIKAQITGTPTIFVNGKLLQGAQLLPVLEEAYKNTQPN